ncbi:alanine--tRNA ligase-related protein, partial [Siminovitchia fortis]|uniref:alanine--tRNA ligase-related protein n=1 Tax=Siminovitchia fortis TaxID=254758 RepID=UPI0036F2969B
PQPKPLTSPNHLFSLYHTYPFPLQLTQQYPQQHQIKVHHDPFPNQIQNHTQTPPSPTTQTHSIHLQTPTLSQFTLTTQFLRYHPLQTHSLLLPILKHPHITQKPQKPDHIQFILHLTPFYPQTRPHLPHH